MNFRITGISPTPFQPLFAMSDAELEKAGMRRVFADEGAGYPCRVSMAHASPGEELLLAPFEHQPAQSPYRASGPIYVRRNADAPFDGINVVPDVVRWRLLSVRAYDGHDLIIDAEVVDGRDVEAVITRLFAQAEVRYLHIHNARRGCYSCRVDRA